MRVHVLEPLPAQLPASATSAASNNGAGATAAEGTGDAMMDCRNIYVGNLPVR